MNELEIENEFEYIDLDLIDHKEEDENSDPIVDVRFQKAAGDEVFIIGVKL